MPKVKQKSDILRKRDYMQPVVMLSRLQLPPSITDTFINQAENVKLASRQSLVDRLNQILTIGISFPRVVRMKERFKINGLIIKLQEAVLEVKRAILELEERKLDPSIAILSLCEKGNGSTVLNSAVTNEQQPEEGYAFYVGGLENQATTTTTTTTTLTTNDVVEQGGENTFSQQENVSSTLESDIIPPGDNESYSENNFSMQENYFYHQVGAQTDVALNLIQPREQEIPLDLSLRYEYINVDD
jgi:hypothetical protein